MKRRLRLAYAARVCRKKTIWPIVYTFLVALTAMPSAAASLPGIQFTRFASADAFASGSLNSLTVDQGNLVVAPGELSGTWVSRAVKPGFTFTRLVASWNVDTPGASRVRVEAQATTTAGETSDWYALGVWAADDHALKKTSVNGQADALGRVDTDTLHAAGGDPFASYSLRVRLERATGDDPSPNFRMLGAEVSDFVYSPSSTVTSTPLTSDSVELSVPGLSQEVHAHQYPQWGGGGEAWCSPTSTEMVIEYWGRGPAADDLAWVDPAYADPSVDFAARSTYDAAYRGTGNWSFNTAYAARFGLDAFVTQLRSLAEAERFVRAGIPLVASIAAHPGELEGFLFSGGTSGHLVVIVGFDASGNPIVNDPAAWTGASVRRVYDRAQFERVWLRGSAGTAYVIHPPDVPLPPTSTDATPNW
jgi:Peptidase_C39 like family